MGVYIKGMEMPKNCLTCACTDSEYGDCILDPEKRCPDDYKKRAEWCPLVSVPPHGRLIDADNLLTDKSVNIIGKGMIFGGQYVFSESEIVNAPTIIEAEEGET